MLKQKIKKEQIKKSFIPCFFFIVSAFVVFFVFNLFFPFFKNKKDNKKIWEFFLFLTPFVFLFISSYKNAERVDTLCPPLFSFVSSRLFSYPFSLKGKDFFFFCFFVSTEEKIRQQRDCLHFLFNKKDNIESFYNKKTKNTLFQKEDTKKNFCLKNNNKEEEKNILIYYYPQKKRVYNKKGTLNLSFFFEKSLFFLCCCF